MTKASFDFSALLDAVTEAREREAAKRGCSVEDLDAVREAEERAERQAEDRREREREVVERRRWIARTLGTRQPPNVMEAFIRGTLDREHRAMVHIREWLAGDASYCFLIGGMGAGKTLAAFEALAQLGGVFVKSPHLGPAIEPWKGDPEHVVTFDPGAPRLVVLDDLGTERAEDSRWATSFDELIDARQGERAGARLRTLITTNLTVEQIAKRYSERARDRIRTSRKVGILDAESMRGRA
jgi:DNA replication protein DnaC